jgi:hypothetical protein
MTTHNARLLTSILSIMTVFLLWLIAVVFKDSNTGWQFPIISPGDLLILTILFLPTVTLAIIICTKLIPVVCEYPTSAKLFTVRLVFCSALVGIFVFGLII